MVKISNFFDDETKMLINEFCDKCDRNGFVRTLRKSYTYLYKDSRSATLCDETQYFSYIDDSGRILLTFINYACKSGVKTDKVKYHVDILYLLDTGMSDYTFAGSRIEVGRFLVADLSILKDHVEKVQLKANEYVKVRKEYNELKRASVVKKMFR